MGYILDLRKILGHRPIIMCGCGCLIFNEKGEVLLQRRKDDNKWGTPGGSMELGESVEENVVREVFEETSLKVKNLKLFKIYSGKKQYHKYPNGDEVYNLNIMFETNEYEGELNINDNESNELKFFAIDDIPKNIVNPCKFIIKDLKEGRKRLF